MVSSKESTASIEYVKTIGTAHAAAPSQIGFRNPVDVALGLMNPPPRRVRSGLGIR